MRKSLWREIAGRRNAWQGVAWLALVIALLFQGGATAQILAGWEQMNAYYYGWPEYLWQVQVAAKTTTPGLVSATMSWRKGEPGDIQSSLWPRFREWNDGSWFLVAMWCTNWLTDGVSATNQFTINGKMPITNYFEYVFTLPPKHKIVITNLMYRMMNDEKRLLLHLRARNDNYTYDLCPPTWTTNFWRIYTNSFKLDSKLNPTRIRLYGASADTKLVYTYWNALGIKISSTHWSALPPSPSSYPAGTSNLMFVFFGYLIPYATAEPDNGPLAGGNFVIVTNAFVTNGISNADITSATLDGKAVTLAGPQGSNWFGFYAPPGNSPGLKNMSVVSVTKGTTLLEQIYTYNPSGVVFRVVPTGGVAGTTVRIIGSNFCNQAGDVTNVLFGNTQVTPSTISPTQIVVTAPAGGGVVGVKIWSTSYGYTEGNNVFTYPGPPLAPELKVLGTNGAIITSGSGVSPLNGSDFGPNLRGIGATNTFSITNSGTSLLTISGVTTSGSGAVFFRVVERPATVAAGARADFKVAFDATAAGPQSAAVRIASDDGLSPFVLNLAGTTVPGYIGTPAVSGVATVGVFSAAQSPNQPGPISLQYTSYRQQNIYSAAKLAAAGLTNPVRITAVGFDVAQAATPHIVSNYLLRFAEAERADWSANNVMQASGLQQVYSNAAAWFSVGASADLILDMTYALSTNVALLVDCAFARPGAPTTLDGQVKVETAVNGMVYSSGAANTVTNLLPRMVFAWQTMSDEGVSPLMTPSTGGTEVAVSGFHLCDGTMGDVTRVTLNGATATVLAVNGSTQVVVRAGPGGTTGLGAVEVVSAKYGRTAVANLFTYNAPGVIGRDWVDEGWSDVPGLPAIRCQGGLAVVSNKLYYIGGADQMFTTQSDVFRFDGTAWSSSFALPQPRTRFGCAEYGGGVHAVGGGNPSEVTNVYRFNSVSWSEVAGLPAPRRSHAAAVLNGVLYAVGGSTSAGAHTNVYAFNGTSWTEVRGLPAPRMFLAAAVLSNRLYAIGGNDGTGDRDTVYEFNGTNWAQTTPLPMTRINHAAATLNGNIYVLGGGGTNVWRFDGSSWTAIKGLPAAQQRNSAAVLNGLIYSAGNTTSTNVYRYSPGKFAAHGVVPAEGLAGQTVTIYGRNLSAGTTSDVTSVTLCGAAAAVVSVAGSTQIVVTAGASAPGTGDVVVNSTAFGQTTAANAFTYVGSPEMLVLGKDGLPLFSGANPSPPGGTDFGIVPAGTAWTNFLSITNPGLIELNIPSWTTNETEVGP